MFAKGCRTVAAGRKRNDGLVRSGSHGKGTRHGNAFLNLESGQTLDATRREKNGGPQHVFTQKTVSARRLASCACISGVQAVAPACIPGCSRAIPAGARLYFIRSFISARPPLTRAARSASTRPKNGDGRAGPAFCLHVTDAWTGGGRRKGVGGRRKGVGG